MWSSTGAHQASGNPRRTEDRKETATASGNAVTFIRGRHVVPSKLENLLNDRFGDQYAVEMRYNSYKVIASHKLSNDDINRCY
ncbi:hypothetical protein QBC33DRAFT_315451 [Phialemonium atrogriseum]|uniref:Uncharacterized protein n=1 Tax=Phialemonium atrogriseum TaxID=1093897 RepID=A0AAJ0C5B0_9PEZI|nr:uncharacterized protein QBC33DRAFT_315451 [Phialemonium atrogriseum]KAK1770230.1 hypothetical protein QBC33DRAFT_315451 [Phialemonium atrogriseum]